MALTESNMLPLGTIAPDFTLPDTKSGEDLSFNALAGSKGTVVMFICNHCPYVVHLKSALVEFANKYQAQGVNFIAISSNDVENYPQDHPDLMAAEAAEFNYPFAYLYDESQAVAKAYNAACTPDFYLFDQAAKCVYRGRFDESSPGKDVPVTGADLGGAIDNMLAGESIATEQIPSMGCNIKWK